ncbi:hypothetical protein GQ457_03G038210 [Hibiscus cannabinus]
MSESKPESAPVLNPRVTWEGCSVLLDINDGDRLVFARLSAGSTLKIGNKTCSLQPLIGCPFGSLFQLESGKEKPYLSRFVPPTEDEGGCQLQEESRDNRAIIDNNQAQSLTGEDIDAMRSQGATGNEIVEALIANSATFEKKTQFSQYSLCQEINKMIGSFLSRGLVMVLGYAYPAYECYKTVEMNKPDVEQLRFWCQYWILVAVLTVSERIGDAFVSWVPMYSEAKLAFFIYLWYPKTRGTFYVYDSFFRPYVAKHENEIDHNLSELRTRAGDMAVLYWQRAASYGQTRFFEILQYVASQSTTPRPLHPQNSQAQGARARQPSGVRSRQSSSKAQAAQPEAEEPPSPTSSTSSSQHQREVAEEVGPSEVAKPTTPSASESTSNLPAETEAEAEAEAMQIETVPPSSRRNEGINPPPQETHMEESIRLTRGRLRKNRSAAR